ncbi:MAG: HEAT repeat domain-containing protein [Candidatus Eisenbacteria bacterium]|nr:HEAT repeat domain-containing protein [Candidatus Eisenbacteria bacterium]
MPELPAGLPPHLALGALVLACAIALLFLLARAARRGAAREHRGRAAELVRLLTGVLAGNVPARELRAAARDSQSEPFWGAVEATAGSLRPRERRVLAHALTRSRHLVVERDVLRREDSPARRELAARRLGLLPAKRSRRLLRRLLAKGPEPMRLAAARALAAHRDLASLTWLLTHPDSLATRPARTISGLLRSFGPRGRALLVVALERRDLPLSLEVGLVDALGLTRCRSARGAIEVRLGSERLDARVAAARALGRLGMGESIPALMLSLADADWPVRAQSAWALGRLGATPAVERLTEQVTDRAWWARRHAAYALAALGPEGRDALCEIVARSPDPFAREMAREALDNGGREARRSA